MKIIPWLASDQLIYTSIWKITQRHICIFYVSHWTFILHVHLQKCIQKQIMMQYFSYWAYLLFNTYNVMFPLTHWGRVTHIFVSELTIIGSDNGLSPGRPQAIIWTNDGLLSIGPLRTYFSENLIKIQQFSLKKMHVKMSSAKWRPSCPGLNVLRQASQPANNGMYRYHSRCWCIFDAIIKAISWF